MEHIAILGISKTTLNLAALFANTGRKVFLFDKTRRGAEIAKEDIFFMTPMPLNSYERGSFINCCGLDLDLDEFTNLDLIIEGWDYSIEERKFLLSSIMMHFKKSASILSIYNGDSVNELSEALNSWFRPHFLGIHFFFNPKFNRLVELIPNLKTERKTLKEIQLFLKEGLGRFPIIVNDKPNLIANRIAIFLTCAAIFRAKQFGISVEELETLTKLVFSNLGGVLFLNQYMGNQKVEDIFNNISQEDKNNYEKIFASFEPDFLKGKVFYQYFQGRFNFKLNNVILPSEIIKNFNERNWKFFKRSAEPYSIFIYYYLIDLWQFLAFVSNSEKIEPQILDEILTNAFGLNAKFFHLLQEFSPKDVFSSILREKKNGNLPYPICEAWRRKKHEKQSIVEVVKEDVFLKEAMLRKEKLDIEYYVYKKNLLIFHPKEKYLDLSLDFLNKLLDEINYARKYELAFMLYLKSEVFGAMGYYRKSTKDDRVRQLEKLAEVLVALRMLEKPYIFSAKGVVADGGVALMMQADQIICDTSFTWKLTTTAENLPPFGGIWFEWLRKIPRFSKDVSLNYIHAVIKSLLGNNAQGNAYTAKEMGMFRANDHFVMNPDNLPQHSKEIADLCLSSFYSRTIRYPVAKLSQSDLEFFRQKAQNTAMPKIYLDCVNLLATEEQTNIISLRKLLKSEINLLNSYLI